MTARHDVVVVGAGVAGSAAAIHLAERGLRVVLLEKERGPHDKVCGEFLSGESRPYLDELGIDPLKLGAVCIDGFRLHGRKRMAECRLPIAAYGISRLVLDEALLKRASEAGVEVRRGVQVKGVVADLNALQGGIILETTQPEDGAFDGRVMGQRLVVATGKSEFKSLNPRRGWDSGLVGFKIHLKLRPSALKRLRGSCDLFVFPHGYGGISEIENGLVNFCFLIEKKALREIGSEWRALAIHISNSNWRISHYLDGAECESPRMCTAANIPYGFLRDDYPKAGVYCVGDQMGVIPSLTGEGMTIALLTARHAADAICAEGGRLGDASNSVSYQSEMRKLLLPRIAIAFQVHRLFRHPTLCDWACGLANAGGGRFPWLVEQLFMATRCPPDRDLQTFDQESHV